MRDLKVALIQEDVRWQNGPANRRLFGDYFPDLVDVDLVVLPEMFTTGFTMAAAEQCETMKGVTVDWMRAQSQTFDFALAGSMIIEEQGRFYNRLLVARPDSTLQWYDKRHLFRMADEHARYTAGMERVVVNVNDWRVALQICYDLRFPVFSRNRGDYDALLYVANWPAARRTAWNTLLKARAMENLSYCVGVNRIGVDGVGVEYLGESAVLDYVGEVLVSAGQAVGVARATLSAARLARFRDKFPADRDADAFHIDI